MDEGRNLSLPATPGWVWENPVAAPRPGDANGVRTTLLTIATADRAAQTRIFARSARHCHPQARLVVLVADQTPALPLFEDLFDLVIAADELRLGGLADMRFRYSTAEVCYALKPWVIRHLFDRFKGDPIYYFDADIELFTPLVEAEAALAQGANLLLTPHILQPGSNPDKEKELLRSGSFNAGFVALAPTAAAHAFVDWWCDRVRTGCTHDALEGTYGDQKWLELAPAICDGVVVLRHPGYNFAYWNAHERPLSHSGGVWSAAGQPLRFVHYSRWNLEEQDSEKYLGRFFAGDCETFAGLFSDYEQKVRDEASLCEPVAAIDDPPKSPAGEAVPEFIRAAYARHGAAIEGDAATVFAHAVAVLGTAGKGRADLPDLPLTVLYDDIWQHHADLRYRFDIDRAEGRLGYLRWLAETGVTELSIPPAFLASARWTLERARVRELEAVEQPPMPVPAIDDSPALPPEAAAAFLATRDAERERFRRQHDDIRLLVSSNKGLRRELHGLWVRRWRDEETIAALERQLAQTRDARDSAARRSQLLAEEVAQLRLQPWRRLVGRQNRPAQPPAAETARQPVLAGDGPFFTRGFLHSDAARITGTTLKRVKRAPSGTLVFGPYVNLTAGTYLLAIDARLYRRLPLSRGFKLDIVRDSARQIVVMQQFRLQSMSGWRHFEAEFAVMDGEESPDFEFRIWARKGTPLEIAAIELFRLADTPLADTPLADTPLAGAAPGANAG